jgi:hypothetical protein
MLIWFWIGSRKRNPNPKIKDGGEADLPGSLSPLSPPPSCGKKHLSRRSVRSRHCVAFASGSGSRAPLRGHSTASRVAPATHVRRRGVPRRRHHRSSIVHRHRFADGRSGCEREGARRKWIRVQGRAAARVFVPPKSPYSHRIRWTAEIHWARSGPGRIEISRPRPRLRTGHGGGRHAWLGRWPARGCGYWAAEQAFRPSSLQAEINRKQKSFVFFLETVLRMFWWWFWVIFWCKYLYNICPTIILFREQYSILRVSKKRRICFQFIIILLLVWPTLINGNIMMLFMSFVMH